MDKRRNNLQNGITLIALVISIIVMLILAGVSLNATIGDNGIITQAQNATYLQSCAVLEEFFNEKYLENYDTFENYESKVDGLIYSKEYSKYFQKASNNDKYFLDMTTYKEYYLIEKNALPEEIQQQIKGGDNSMTGQGIYADFSDVYGITNDLKVYYCSNGSDTRIGAEDNAVETNMNKVIANKDTAWAKALGYTNDVTFADIKSKNGNLEINQNGLDLNFLANFSNIDTITFSNVTYANLDGIEKVPKLTNIYFKNNITIKDYSKISSVKELTHLYFINSNDAEIEKCFSKANTGIGNYDLEKLEYLAITSMDYRHYWDSEKCGSAHNENITTVAPIANLSDKTKQKIKYLNLACNKIETIEFLNDFSNLYLLKIGGNKIKSLNGISGLKNLTYIVADNNLLGEGIDNPNFMKDSLDALSAIATIKTTGNDITNYTFENKLPSLYFLNLENNNLIWVNYVKNCENLRYLYLNGNTNINVQALQSIKILIKNHYYWEYSYDSKYSLLFLDSATTSLDIHEQTIEKDTFSSLADHKQLISLNLNNVTIQKKDNNGNLVNIEGEEQNSIINSTLAPLTNLQGIGLIGFSGLTDLSFIKNMKLLSNIDLRDTGVITYNGDKSKNGLELLNDKLNMYNLAINNSNINLVYIQDTINRLGTSKVNSDGSYPDGCSAPTGIVGMTTGVGLFCPNNTSLKTLENCTEIVNLVSLIQAYGGWYNTSLDLSKCTKLNSIYETYWQGSQIILPSSLESLSSGPASRTNYNTRNCKKLKSIYVSEGWESSSIFQTMTDFSTIETICVEGMNAPQQFINCVDYWKNCINLKKIEIRQSHWWTTKLNINSLSFCEKLQNLNKLTNLILRYINVNDNNYLPLKNLKSLQTMDINNCNLNDISFVSEMTNLVSANLSTNEIINGIGGLSNLKKLQYLNLNYNTIEDLSNYEGKNANVSDILIGLHPNNGGNLRALFLKGNLLTTMSLNKLKDLSWPNGKGGF